MDPEAPSLARTIDQMRAVAERAIAAPYERSQPQYAAYIACWAADLRAWQAEFAAELSELRLKIKPDGEGP